MGENRGQPFYSEYAWAYDLLIDRPVRKECSTVVAWLGERGVRPGAELLDAGCGTGRYASELARRGYVVRGMDRSPELIDVARRSNGERPGALSFTVGDILESPSRRYDAILCRGVLNDFIDDALRRAVLVGFAKALRPSGVLILDVRDWDASAERKTREPLFRKRVATDRGLLTFTSITKVDRNNRRLLVSEKHALAGYRAERSNDYEFVIRCWTRDELDSGLMDASFEKTAYFGAYDPSVEAGSTDRLVAVAQLPRSAA